MSISKEISTEEKLLTIFVEGRFDFSSHQLFRQAYEGVEAEKFCVDLSKTTYLDSSALGMLLLLRDHAGGDKAAIEICNCNEDVRNIFSISNFDQLFNIV